MWKQNIRSIPYVTIQNVMQNQYYETSHMQNKYVGTYCETLQKYCNAATQPKNLYFGGLNRQAFASRVSNAYICICV